MLLSDQWIIEGSVLETRRLTSQKNSSWHMNIIKVGTIGKTFELQTEDDNIASQLYAGALIVADGEFSFNNGNTVFSIKNFKFQDSKK